MILLLLILSPEMKSRVETKGVEARVVGKRTGFASSAWVEAMLLQRPPTSSHDPGRRNLPRRLHPISENYSPRTTVIFSSLGYFLAIYKDGVLLEEISSICRFPPSLLRATGTTPTEATAPRLSEGVILASLVVVFFPFFLFVHCPLHPISKRKYYI